MSQTTYQITSKAGQDMGQYEGRTPAEALVAMHLDAGYRGRMSLSDDLTRIIFADAETERLCGSLEDYEIREAD